MFFWPKQQQEQQPRKGKQAKAGKPFVPNCIIAINKKEKGKRIFFTNSFRFCFPFLACFLYLPFSCVFCCFVLSCFVLLLVLPTGRLNVNFTRVLLGHRTRQMSFRRETKLKTNFARWAAAPVLAPGPTSSRLSLMCIRKISNVMRVKQYLGFGFSSSIGGTGSRPFWSCLANCGCLCL